MIRGVHTYAEYVDGTGSNTPAAVIGNLPSINIYWETF